MTSTAPVLVVGGTGMLGSQVVGALQRLGKGVRALVRPGSDAARLEASGVEISRGDMLAVESLLSAMDGVDAVVTTAAGYTRHRKGDTSEIDTLGNANLAEAASRVGVRRFVLTSILTCDRTPAVPHFWHKKLAEDHLDELGVPFVALRPGAFLDQIVALGGGLVDKRRLMWFGSTTVPMTCVLTPDVADSLAAAVDAPGVDGQRIDLGWDRPVSVQDIADIAGSLLHGRVRVWSVPAVALRVAGTLLAPVSPTGKDMSAMIDWFQTGRYVADTARQRAVFGPPPAAEEAVARLVRGLESGGGPA